jgi:hypothetical protein
LRSHFRPSSLNTADVCLMRLEWFACFHRNDTTSKLRICQYWDYINIWRQSVNPNMQLVDVPSMILVNGCAGYVRHVTHDEIADAVG